MPGSVYFFNNSGCGSFLNGSAYLSNASLTFFSGSAYFSRTVTISLTVPTFSNSSDSFLTRNAYIFKNSIYSFNDSPGVDVDFVFIFWSDPLVGG